MVVAPALLGLALGALAVWLLLRRRETVVRGELGSAREALARAETAVEMERRAAVEQARLRSELETTFRALSAEALQRNNQSFLQLARTQLEGLQQAGRSDLEKEKLAVAQLVQPIRESLEKVDGQVKSLEQSRRQDYGVLTEQLRSLAESNHALRGETASLVTALRAPATRGRWGEMQLRRAVETAGMVSYCDFVEQQTAVTADDRMLRPDLIVRLAGGRSVVVDAKTPLQALLDAHEATDEATSAEYMKEFVRHVRGHMAKLAAKAYWQQFEPAPDFVLMYLPGESFYRYALEQDPTLLDDRRVILAGPANLITLLRTIATGWREQTIADEARAISERGRELYERLATMTDHMTTLGRRLDGAVQAYNQTVGSFERRVLVSARRFPEHGIGSDKELPAPAPIDRSAQPPQAIELAPLLGEQAQLTTDASAA